jgi:hypothetical protein
MPRSRTVHRNRHLPIGFGVLNLQMLEHVRRELAHYAYMSYAISDPVESLKHDYAWDCRGVSRSMGSLEIEKRQGALEFQSCLDGRGWASRPGQRFGVP